ncbi:hypothetical protein NPIL_202021 [Nephila pilipes]|uniref:Uncharacterized protein n=1 Tax=Nephila pilipes TaxID=299642 RepID=A0A8X6PCG6_NEPPI|nr:hypothetical protein NPIL_202021 [Nephila pilipes]
MNVPIHERKHSFSRPPTNALLKAQQGEYSDDSETNSTLNRFVSHQLPPLKEKRGDGQAMSLRGLRFRSYLGTPEGFGRINQPSRKSQVFVTELGTCLEFG